MASNVNANYSSEVSIKSYNVHGINQGINLLDVFCKSCTDVIFIQESWLTVKEADRYFCVFQPSYHIFNSSPMDKTLSTNILRGRPFGGLSVFIHDSFYKMFNNVNCIASTNHYIIIKADKLLFINVYLPSVNSSAILDTVGVILSEIVDICATTSHEALFIGGDLNSNVLESSPVSNLINSSFNSIDSFVSYSFFNDSPSNSFSFSAPSRNASSLIDFFFLSQNLGSVASNFAIINHPLNLSDHLPISISFSRDLFLSFIFDSPSISPVSSDINFTNPNKKLFDWESGNKIAYYEATRISLAELSQLFTNLSFDDLRHARPDIFTENGINTIYENLIHALFNASLSCFKIKVKSKSNNKWWWDDELRQAKSASIFHWQRWRQSGFLQNGPEFSDCNDARLSYKKLVRLKKSCTNNMLNDTLFQL